MDLNNISLLLSIFDKAFYYYNSSSKFGIFCLIVLYLRRQIFTTNKGKYSYWPNEWDLKIFTSTSNKIGIVFNICPVFCMSHWVNPNWKQNDFAWWFCWHAPLKCQNWWAMTMTMAKQELLCNHILEETIWNDFIMLRALCYHCCQFAIGVIML